MGQRLSASLRTSKPTSLSPSTTSKGTIATNPPRPPSGEWRQPVSPPVPPSRADPVTGFWRGQAPTTSRNTMDARDVSQREFVLSMREQQQQRSEEEARTRLSIKGTTTHARHPNLGDSSRPPQSRPLSPTAAGYTLSPIEESNTITDMSEELRRFIQDVGPLQKKEVPERHSTTTRRRSTPVDASPASPVIPLEPDRPPVTAELPSHQRVRSTMPLAQNVEGYDTQRTTNFSHQTAYTRDNPHQFFSVGGDAQQLFAFVMRKYEDHSSHSSVDPSAALPISTTPSSDEGTEVEHVAEESFLTDTEVDSFSTVTSPTSKNDTTIDAVSGNVVTVRHHPHPVAEGGAPIPTTEWDQIVEDYYHIRLNELAQQSNETTDQSSSTTSALPNTPNVWTLEDHDRHRLLLKETLAALDIPVILRDTDGSFVGAHHHRVAELANLKIFPVPSDRVRLLLADPVQDVNDETNDDAPHKNGSPWKVRRIRDD